MAVSAMAFSVSVPHTGGFWTAASAFAHLPSSLFGVGPCSPAHSLSQTGTSASCFTGCCIGLATLFSGTTAVVTSCCNESCLQRLQAKWGRRTVVRLEVDEQVGRFPRDGREYYRLAKGQPLYEVIPDSIVSDVVHFKIRTVWANGDGSVKKKTNESIMPGSLLVRSPNLPYPFTFAIGELSNNEFKPDGLGTRINNDWSFSAAHVFPDPEIDFICVHANGRAVKAKILERRYYKGDLEEISGTAYDVIFFRMEPHVYADCGIKAYTKGICKKRFHTCQVMGMDKDGFFSSRGSVYTTSDPSISQDCKAFGVALHRCSTLPGASGSPIVAFDGGTPMIHGMHIQGAREGADYNVFITGPALHHAFRKVFEKGISITSVLQARNESGNKYFDMQEEWDDLQDAAEWDMMSKSERRAWMEENRYAEGPSAHDEWLENATGMTGEQYANADPGVKHNNFSVTTTKRAVTGPVAAKSNLTVQSGKKSWADFNEKTFSTPNESFSLPKDDPRCVFAVGGMNLRDKTKRFWSRHEGDVPPYCMKDKSKPPVDVTYSVAVKWLQDLMEGNFNVAFDIMTTDDKKLMAMFRAHKEEDAQQNHAFVPFLEYYDSIVGRVILECNPLDPLLDSHGKPLFTNTHSFKARSSKSAKFSKGLCVEDKELLQSMGYAGDMVTPDNSETGVHDSLKVTSSKVTDGYFEPTVDEFDYLVGKFLLKDEDRPSVPKDGLKHLLSVFHMFDNKSSGLTSLWRNLTKKEVVTQETNAFAAIVFTTMMLRLAAWRDIATATPMDLFHRGLIDPKDMFIKSDCYAERKAKEKAWRTIFNVSLRDNCLIGFGVKPVCSKLMDKYQENRDPSYALGMGHHDEGIQHLGGIVEKWKEVYQEDASGWDWSVKRDWILYTDAILTASYTGPHSAGWSAILTTNFLTSSTHVLANHKRLWSQKTYCIMPSGGMDTALINNVDRSGGAHLGMISAAVKEKKVESLRKEVINVQQNKELPSRSMDESIVRSYSSTGNAQLSVGIDACTVPFESLSAGDDLLTTKALDPDKLKCYGTKSRDASKGDPKSSFTFTSHNYEKENGVWKARFLNFEKCITKLMLSGAVPTLEQLSGLRFVLRHTPKVLADFDRICKEKSWIVPSEVDDTAALEYAEQAGYYDL